MGHKTVIAVLTAMVVAAVGRGFGAAEPTAAPAVSPDVAGVWESVPDAMRHLQSGMRCVLFVEGIETRIDATHVRKHYIPLESVSLVSSSRPRGDDVACNYHDAEGREAIITATRLREGETSSDLFAATKAEVMTSMPNAKDVYNRSEMLMDFFRYQGQGHRHADIASFRIEGGVTVRTLAIVMDAADGWAVQVEILDLSPDFTRVVERAALLSWKLTDQIKAARP